MLETLLRRGVIGALAAAPLLALTHPVPATQTEVTAPSPAFQDQTEQLGLRMGGEGACWVDLDNDGWSDLCAGGAVWRNGAGKQFTKIAEIGSAVAGDFDNDGYADLFSWSQKKLYRSKRGTAFEEVKLPDLPETLSRGACWCDLNRDGFLDLYLGGFEDWDRNRTYPSLILQNEAGRSFKLLWSDATYRTRGVTACDFDQDGDPDVYVSNYRLQPNRLMLNDGAGQLQDKAAAYNALATSPPFSGGHSIGACWGDFDNDGHFDLFAGNFAHVDSRGDQPKSRFLRNTGPTGSFKFDDRGPCGVSYQESYASPAAGDFNNDGRLDLFFTTVYATASFGRPNQPVLFQNQGGFAFAEVTAQRGLAGLPPTYQAAWADFNRDGALDLLTAGKLWVNQKREGHWLGVRLSGDGKRVNRSAIGAQVRIRLKDRTLTRQVEAGTGEGNQNDLTLHFGLGDRTDPVDLEIAWPEGSRQIIRKVRVDRIVQASFRTPSR